MGKKNAKNQTLKKLSGKEGFDVYYAEIFGTRWENLKCALSLENKYATWQVQDKEKYFLDPASVFAASLLPLDGAKEILDLCAAPGGKTLVISSRMGSESVLVSNERSASRKQRLSLVCDNCLPQDIRSRIKISCSDGSKWCTTQIECYDRILLDVPCSSERHVLADEKYLDDWSPSRVKSLAMEQWALLSSAWRLLRTGGYLLYSTCALCPLENDGVISRLLKKFEGAEQVFLDEESVQKAWNETFESVKKFCSDMPSLFPERTQCGFHILPDKQNGYGPIWFVLLHKTKPVTK